MADGNGGNDEAAVMDLVNNPVTPDTDTVGLPAFLYAFSFLEVV